MDPDPATQGNTALNIDFALPGTTCRIGGQTVVFEGDIVLEGDSDGNGQ